MVAFQGGHPPFKGDSPYLRPQPSWAESSPTRSKVLPLRCGGWVPRVMQADPEQKEPNRRVRCMQPPRGYEHSSTFAQTSGQKGGQPRRRHATAPSGCAPSTSNAPSMGAHAHASCNQRAGRYVQATAPPLAPLPRLLDCGTSTTPGWHRWVVRHIIRFHILFLFPLSLSYNRGQERGIPRKGSFSVKETGSEPPY
jgi:hypothetical protein